MRKQSVAVFATLHADFGPFIDEAPSPPRRESCPCCVARIKAVNPSPFRRLTEVGHAYDGPFSGGIVTAALTGSLQVHLYLLVRALL